MRLRALNFLAAGVLYFLLHAVTSVIEEVFNHGPVTSILLLFPLAKVLGDGVMMVVKQEKYHSFAEEWLKETALFSALAVVALVAREFWFNALQLTEPPGLVFVVVCAYALMNSFRRGARQESELS